MWTNQAPQVNNACAHVGTFRLAHCCMCGAWPRQKCGASHILGCLCFLALMRSLLAVAALPLLGCHALVSPQLLRSKAATVAFRQPRCSALHLQRQPARSLYCAPDGSASQSVDAQAEAAQQLAEEQALNAVPSLLDVESPPAVADVQGPIDLKELVKFTLPLLVIWLR
jgi:hypothetical protein